MKKYIVFIVVFLVSIFFLTGCKKDRDKQILNDLEVIKQRGYITIGVKNDSKPFGYYDSRGNLSGFDIDIAREIAKNIFNDTANDHIRFVVVNPQNRIQMLNSKKVDILVATMSVNEKRKLVVDFSSPYFVANQKIMVRQGSKITHINYFNSKGKFAVILGTTGEKISHLIAPNANVVGAKTYNQAAKYLRQYEVDAILGDDCILNGLNKNNEFKIINRSYSREYYAVAIRKTPDSKELLNLINATIASVLDSKKMNVIKSKYKI